MTGPTPAGSDRVVLQATSPLAVCQEVVDRNLHPELVDVDTGARILPLVLDDRRHFTLWIRLYSRTLAARNLFLAGHVERARWEIGAALVATEQPPCYLESVYLELLRDLLTSANRALAAGETTVDHHGPYVALTEAENGCLLRLFRRQVHVGGADSADVEIADIAAGRDPTTD